MKIEGVDVVGRQISLADDFPVSYESHEETDHVFVRVRTDTDHTGYGEGTALPWFTGETTASMEAFVSEWLAPRIVGKDIDDASATHAEFASSFPGNPGAKTAVELALLDLRGKRAGVPVRELLGATVHDRVSLVWPVPGLAPKRAVETVDDALDAGFRRFKIKATGDVPTDIERINAVLERLPEHATARIDPNTSWETFPKAARAAQSIDHLEKLEYFEQPVSPDRPDDLRRLWHESGVPVFADEFVHDLADVERLGIERLAAGCQLKLAKTGSLADLAHMAHTAREHDLDVTVVSAFGTSLEATAMLHLAATASNLSLACELDPALITEDPTTSPIAVKPEIEIPDGPGLGVELEDSLF